MVKILAFDVKKKKKAFSVNRDSEMYFV